jgi:L-cysteine desulfidase
MALKGIVIPSDNGILGCTAERTIQNLGRVSGEGMNNTDNVILDVMLHRCV